MAREPVTPTARRTKARPRAGPKPAPGSDRPGGAVAATGRARSPGSDEVRERILRLQTRHPERVCVRTVSLTAEGRPIDAVTVTDARADDADKQHVLVAGGQHGNEESARLVALRLIDYLLSPAARPLLRRQRVVVMPNVSPDAAERDAYETPAGIKPNLDHPDTGATSPEGRALETVAAGGNPPGVSFEESMVVKVPSGNFFS